MTSQVGTHSKLHARKCGRIRCQWTHCSLGEVLDFCAEGLRVKCRRKPAAPVHTLISVTIEGLDGPFPVNARIAWKRRVGFFSWQIGLELIDISHDARTRLAHMARAAMISGSLDRQDQMGGSQGLGIGGV